MFFAFYLSEERYNTYIGGQEWTFVWAGSIITVQSLFWLVTKWNVDIDALFTTVGAKDVRYAALIKVIPVTNAGSAEICKLERDTVRRESIKDLNVANASTRKAERETSHFFSKKGGSCTIMTRSPLRRYPTPSI